MGVEQAEEPIVQHLRLANGGVADVDLDGVVRTGSFSRLLQYGAFPRGSHGGGPLHGRGASFGNGFPLARE